MAPRTQEQQIAYNAKRRGENADKTQTKLVAIADKLMVNKVKVAKINRTAKAVGKIPKAASKPRKPKPTKAEVEAKVAKMDKRLKGLLTVHGVSEAEATEVVVKRRARPLSQEPLYRDETSLLAAKLRARGAFPPVAQDAPAGSALLLPRSYRRGYKGLGATARGNVLQVTVTMTKDQFAVLKERADMYNCSLAEAVRRCVMAGPLS